MRIVVDTDTASDDAIALALAIRAESLTVDAVTTVAGNVDRDQATANAKAALAAADAPVGAPPVYEGAGQPLLKDYEDAEDVHGPGGLGAHQASTGRPSASGHAADAIVDHVRDGARTLVCLGPLTNVAMALQRDPELAAAVDAVWVMGGAVNTLGNVTPAAEYNFWVDPDAAKLVCRELDVTLIDWGVARRDGVLTAATYDRLAELDTPLARFVVDVSETVRRVTREREGVAGAVQADVLAMACVAGLDHATTAAYLTVDEREGLTRGYSLADTGNVLGRSADARIVTEADADGLQTMVSAACRGGTPEAAIRDDDHDSERVDGRDTDTTDA